MTKRPVTGKWFEELTPGLMVDHAIRRTVTESDNVFFSAVTMNPAALHLDFEYAAQTEFGQPLVNSMFTLALVIGLSIHQLTFGTTVANLGFEQVSFPSPVFHGDTIRVQTEVLAARGSESRPDQGIVKLEHRGFKQGDVEVCRAVRNALMHKRPD
ncbi:MAG TPA: MaoC family dehydratase [Acidimicrobiia bacterium]|nr:MaoC family dehydratase [Acidimicrobiia bacterium]